MLAVEILKLLNQRGALGDEEIAETLSSFGLLEKDHSAMHPGLRHPRYRVSTVSLNEVRHIIRILVQLDLVANRILKKQIACELTERGKKLLSELDSRNWKNPVRRISSRYSRRGIATKPCFDS
jgi:hypothetical protein